MDGRIIKFFKDKGFGFIKTQENEYFFHISDISDIKLEINIGQLVTFTPGENNKGKKAINIVLSPMNNKFIDVFGTRIKISNIKNYGIDKNKREYTGNEYIADFSWSTLFKKKYKDEYFLYITTFQNDNFRWGPSSSDEKYLEIINQLDNS